jgi:CopG family nickel-responsive transcriptional regulator
MPIVSVSLNDDIIGEIDKLQKELGFSGRSEIVRAGLRNLIAEERERKNLIGDIHAVMLVVHDERSDNEVNEMGHSFDKIITTHIHSKTDKRSAWRYSCSKAKRKRLIIWSSASRQTERWITSVSWQYDKEIL